MASKIKIEGLDKLLKKLADLSSESKQKVILRKSARAGIAPVAKAERAECPEDKGNLERALDKKIGGKGFRISAIAGADINYVGDDGAKPGHYDHLVIRGHVAEDGTVIPPNDFISRAYEQSKAEAEARYTAKLKDEIEKLATQQGG
jgi:HK97 gp10 family phage protein